MKTRTVYLPILGELSDRTPCAINIPFGFELGEKDGTIGLVRNGSGIDRVVDWRNHIGDPSPGERAYESQADPVRSDEPITAGEVQKGKLERATKHESAREELGALHRIQEAVAREWGIDISGDVEIVPKSAAEVMTDFMRKNRANVEAARRPRRESAVGEAEELVDFIRQEVSDIMATRPANEIVVRVVIEDRRNG